MGKYLFKRILFSILSLIVVVGIVMILVYTAIHRNVVLQTDDLWNKKKENDRIMYEYTRYEDYGYLDLYDYGSFLKTKYQAIYGDDYSNQDDYKADMNAIKNSDEVWNNASVQEFVQKYKTEKNYNIKYLAPVNYQNGKQKPGGRAYLFAVDEKSVFSRLLNYFTHIVSFETTNQVKDPNLTKDQRYVRFEKDPYSWAGFALVGSGTQHKYLLYFDTRFPFIHQNWMHLRLGTSYTTNRGSEIMDVVMTPTGNLVKSYQQYPKWIQEGRTETEYTALDFHTATYNKAETLTAQEMDRYPDRYTTVSYKVSGLTPVGNSFVMGIIATVIAYVFGIMLGITQARHKDKFFDHLGNAYIVFVTAVPSLAYIFIVASIGTKFFHLPLKFASADNKILAYIMPIISLSLGSIGSEMKWVRRYMIDQMNSDYVKFARAEGMSEREIYNKHISRNAMIYIVQGIPASVLFALTGALLTERVYAVPGVGGKMIDALNSHDNAVIVAMTLIFTTISILGEILGDLLLAKYDPRISLSSSSGGGRK